jgi:hypothetical protein
MMRDLGRLETGAWTSWPDRLGSWARTVSPSVRDSLNLQPIPVSTHGGFQIRRAEETLIGSGRCVTVGA